MTTRLTQSDLEQLTAYFDGELDELQARQVEALIAADPAWNAAAVELENLDAVLEDYQVPAASDDLAQRIIMAARAEQTHGRLVVRFAKYWAPVAAAAAAAVLFLVFYQAPEILNPTLQNTDQTATAEENTAVETLVVEHLDFFKQYDSLDKIAHTDNLVDDATLQAIEQLERPQGT